MFNAVDPRFVLTIFEGAKAAGADYLDMAMSLSSRHPSEPYAKVGVKLGDDQLAQAAQWEAEGRLALVGIGVEPGLSDVFARYAADHLFSHIDELGTRDGANLVIRDEDGNEVFAPGFSMWTIIEECLNPPVVWERSRAVGADGSYDVEAGFYTLPPFAEPEVFEFPDGIGPVECVHVEHEEVLLMPRWVEAEKVTFKYGLGEEMISILRALHTLGLDGTDPVSVKGVQVSPRDVVAAVLPDPATIGPRMEGKTCAGLWVTGTGKDGRPRRTYLYHVSDNADTMRDYDAQCVVWQTAVNPVVALELLAAGAVARHRRARPGGVRRGALPRAAGRPEAGGLRLPLGPRGPLTHVRAKGSPHGHHPEVPHRVRAHPAAHRRHLARGEQWRPLRGARPEQRGHPDDLRRRHALTTAWPRWPRPTRRRPAGPPPRRATAARSCAGPSRRSWPGPTSSPP